MKYLIFFISLNVSAATLTWVAPTKREDNTQLLSSEIAGYIIYCYQSGVKVLEQSVANVTAAVVDLPTGRAGCDMVTIDTDGRKSARSNSVVIEPLPVSKPKPPVLQ